MNAVCTVPMRLMVLVSYSFPKWECFVDAQWQAFAAWPQMEFVPQWPHAKLFENDNTKTMKCACSTNNSFIIK